MIRIQRSQRGPRPLRLEERQQLPILRALPGASAPLRVAREPGRVVVPTGRLPVYLAQPSGTKPALTARIKAQVRDRLYDQQHGKCCYCEAHAGKKGRDVEHFRPCVVYWWLAWSWKNLLFSCDICNRTKSDYFPLETPAVLEPERLAPGLERAYLLDPALRADDDPLEHIEFRRVQPNGVRTERWRPFPRSGSRRGSEIIAAVGLDRADLLDRYNAHAEQMADVIQALRDVFGRGQVAEIRQFWSQKVHPRWLSARFPFTALSRDILTSHFSPEIAQHGLDCSIHYPP